MIWTDLGLFLLLTAGHTEVLVTLVNRVHATRWPCRLLQQIRHLHDFLIPAFPLALLVLFWIQGAGLSPLERWQECSWISRLYLSVCLCGSVGLLYSSLRWMTRSLPQQVKDVSSKKIDVAQKLGRLPLANGPFRTLAKVPGNEIFQVEFVERKLLLPRLPHCWHGTTVLHLSDWHFTGTIDLSFYEAVCEIAAESNPEWILFTGDLIDRQELVKWIPRTLGKLKAPLGCHYILGNHDWYQDPQEVRDVLNNCGWGDVAERWIPVEKGGKSLLLGGTEAPWLGKHPLTPEPTPEEFRVLLSHTPDHFGWARDHRVDLMLSGHNHGGQVVLPLIGPVYSPSKYGVKYSGGIFYRDPTLLVVSRGLGARHPLRINCPPEVTLLTLCRPELEADHSSFGRRSINESVASIGDFSSNKT